MKNVPRRGRSGLQINAILANKKAKNHKAPQRAPSSRAWSLPPAVREAGKRNAEGLSSEARLKECPARSENKRANPYETRLKEDIP